MNQIFVRTETINFELQHDWICLDHPHWVQFVLQLVRHKQNTATNKIPQPVFISVGKLIIHNREFKSTLNLDFFKNKQLSVKLMNHNCYNYDKSSPQNVGDWCWYWHGVQVGGWLVQQQDAGLAEDGSGQTHQLFVAVAQNAAAVLQLKVQLIRELFDDRLQPNLQESHTAYFTAQGGGCWWNMADFYNTNTLYPSCVLCIFNIWHLTDVSL